MSLYPLKFKTIYKEKIWGGDKIRSVLGKDYGDLSNCGETWEISGVEGNVSVVEEGKLAGNDLKTLINKYKGTFVGEKVYHQFGNEFPLLIKFIDANADLSIQVHPNDELAKERHNSFGKTEMWYIMHATKGATLISGFNQVVSKEDYLENFNNGTLSDILNVEKVSSDDVYFLPAGRVHTIGKGLLVAEIQQTSDVTYRIYDFDRTDEQGNKRELHTEQALNAIDYNFYENYKTDYQDTDNEPVRLVDCQYFTTNKLVLSEPHRRDYSTLDSFVIFICLEGNGTIRTADDYLCKIKIGDSILIPASYDSLEIVPDGNLKLLETYVP